MGIGLRDFGRLQLLGCFGGLRAFGGYVEDPGWS